MMKYIFSNFIGYKRSQIWGLVWLSLFNSITVLSQDIHFSQLTETQMFFNPASAGASPSDQRVALVYRNQWASISSSPFVTYGMSYDFSIKKRRWRDKHFGIGTVLFKDVAGDLNLSSFKGALLVSYHKRVSSNSYLSGGINLGVRQSSIDFGNAQWGNQYDGYGNNSNMASNEVFQNQSFTRFDAGVGVIWTMATRNSTISSNNAKYLRIGLSAYHLNQSNQSFSNLDTEKGGMTFRAYLMSSIGIYNTNYAIRPVFHYQRKFNNQEAMVGLMARARIKGRSHYTGYIKRFDLIFGGYYRFLYESLIPTLQMNFNSFTFGISYDVNISGLAMASRNRGGIEFMLKYAPLPKPNSSNFPRF